MSAEMVVRMRMVPGKRVNMFAFMLVFMCIIMGALGQISMKAGMSQMERINGISELIDVHTIKSIIYNVYVMGGLFLYMISAFLWLGALSTLEVSFMYPLLSLAYVITAIGAFIFLGETITIMRWMGIWLVIAGCFLVTRS